MFKRFNYKERPDLMPDAPKKTGFFLFWELYIRKFWRLVTVNLLYFVFTLPLVIYVYIAIANYLLDTAITDRYLIIAGFPEAGVTHHVALLDSDEAVLYSATLYATPNHETGLNQIHIKESQIGKSIFLISSVTFDGKSVPSEGISVSFSYDAAYDFIPGMRVFAYPFIRFLPQNVFNALAVLSILLYGPIMMGVTYVYRNFAREEHAWISDVFSRGVSNIVQGVIFGLLDIVITASLVISAFGNFLTEVGGLTSVAVQIIARIGLVVFIFARQYFYLQAVTIRLSVAQIVMNSLRFVLIGFVRNIIAVAACAIATFVLVLLIPQSALLTLPFLFYSLTGFITVFTVYPVVKRYIIDPATIDIDQNETEEEATTDDE
ncbi:MAG: hypothetical protein LBC65_06520 [Oscillospiraceae bacterium]|jgi:hypothetical protein|nr:hypothetical protein [Oscillospiraceae bacterium]